MSEVIGTGYDTRTGSLREVPGSARIVSFHFHKIMATTVVPKRRPKFFTPFKVGRKVFFKGEPYIITAVDSWGVDETYLAIQKDLTVPYFEVVEASEITVIPSLY